MYLCLLGPYPQELVSLWAFIHNCLAPPGLQEALMNQEHVLFIPLAPGLRPDQIFSQIML